MSIINEALKKTEQDLKKNTANDQPKPIGRARPKPYLLYILILLAGFALSNSIFGLLQHKIKTIQAPNKNAAAVDQIINPPPFLPILPSPSPQEHKPIETSFVLNGIFFSDNDGYALVNNQIVRKNDFVDGAKVSLITANSVQLDNAGETITLSTRR